MIARYRTIAVVNLATFALLIPACTSQPGGGGGGGGNNNANTNEGDGQNIPPVVDAPVVEDRGGFFGDAEAWAVASDNFIAAGYGTRFEFMAINDAGNETACVGINPPGTVRYDGDQVQFEAEYEGIQSGDRCEVVSTGDGNACAPTVLGPMPGQCDIPNVSGRTVVENDATGLNQTWITRFSPCGDRLTTLFLIDEWAIFNIHPFSVFLVTDPASVGGIVIIGGERNYVVAAGIATSTDSAANEPCLDENPTGFVSFDRETLEIDLETAGGCTIQFTGDVAYCAELDPASTGNAGSTSVMIRLEGTGQFNTLDASHPLDSMYLGYGGDAQIPIRR